MGFQDDKSAGGGMFAPSWKPNGLGDGFKGEVLAWREEFATKFGSEETLTDKNGNPIKQYVVTVQTPFRNWDRVSKVPTDDDGREMPASEDNGNRNVYIKYDTNTGAAAQAVIAAMPEADDLSDAVGGVLMGKLTEQRPTTKGNPFNIFEYRFEAPAKEGGFQQAAASSAEPDAAPKAEAPSEPPF